MGLLLMIVREEAMQLSVNNEVGMLIPLIISCVTRLDFSGKKSK